MAGTGLNSGGRIRRFGTSRVVEHWAAVIALCILIATGLSQKFYYLDASSWLIFHLGGIDSVRLIHRYTGVAFSFLVMLHVVTAMGGVVLRKWQPSMLINKKDFVDLVHNIKYYAGAVDHPSRCDRYDYKQKFEYWGILTGGLVMAVTGFALWFPTSVARFLPGEFIPAAKALHTNEALLIFVIIAIWHVYNAIFNPEVFPLDTSIFTGYISRERMLREHPLELARLEGVSLDELLSHHGEETGAKHTEEASA
jgi:formate dehydrogenase gamma subunit